MKYSNYEKSEQYIAASIYTERFLEEFDKKDSTTSEFTTFRENFLHPLFLVISILDCYLDDRASEEEIEQLLKIDSINDIQDFFAKHNVFSFDEKPSIDKFFDAIRNSNTELESVAVFRDCIEFSTTKKNELRTTKECLAVSSKEMCSIFDMYALVHTSFWGTKPSEQFKKIFILTSSIGNQIDDLLDINEDYEERDLVFRVSLFTRTLRKIIRDQAILMIHHHKDMPFLVKEIKKRRSYRLQAKGILLDQ